MARGNATRALTTKDGKPASRAERHRESIRVGMAVRYLHDVVQGTEEANAARIGAAKFLISKVIPAPEPIRDRSDQAKDVSGQDVRTLLTIIDGESERKE